MKLPHAMPFIDSFIFEYLDSASLGDEAMEQVTDKYLFMGKDLPKSKQSPKKSLANYEASDIAIPRKAAEPKRGFGASKRS